MSLSLHTLQTVQHRAIPPAVDQWLDQFGDEAYDGHGGLRVFFSKVSVRRISWHSDVTLSNRTKSIWALTASMAVTLAARLRWVGEPKEFSANKKLIFSDRCILPSTR